MYSIRQISGLFLLTLMMLSRLANAELKYEQKATLSTFESQKAAEKMAQAFRRAAEGDLNIKIMNIKYEQEKLDSSTLYHAIINCHVAKIDEDIFRIQGKILREINKDQ